MPGQYSENRCSVATLGMFIIDEFKRDGRFELISKQPGGAGLYTSLGARIWFAP